LLPHHYTSNESNRMYLAYFIVSALDLLGALDNMLTNDERQGYIDWIYRCQHPDGGFRMWPGTDFGARANRENARWDPANIPATYFALATLLILKDDFKRINRRDTLAWLPRMQRPDGSFGETLVSDRIEGGQDPRFGYCAAGIRYMLRGTNEGDIMVEGQTVRDVDVDAFVRCVRLAEVGTLASRSRIVADTYANVPYYRHMTVGSPMHPSTSLTQGTRSVLLAR